MIPKRFVSPTAVLAAVLTTGAIGCTQDANLPAAPASQSNDIPKIDFEKYTLPNGLDVILSEDHRLPMVAVNMWYHVGPANEAAGRTDFDRTNYFETLPSNELELGLWLESDRMGYLLDVVDQQSLSNQQDVVRNERRQSIEN